MAVEDQGEGTKLLSAILTRGDKMCLDVGAQSGTAAQVKEMYHDDHAPKARKPYTITKQRERWTEEEHKKFLEALKLYGRAWRRIEEHVGSKTAVQIRSHAQKFFSKVVRESSSTEVSSPKAIEIPPPRPKRKPMHPYPRKLIDTIKKRTSAPQQSERSPSPNLSTSEQENQSPKSVLSAIGSDTLGSTISNSQNGSPSPTSSAPVAKPYSSIPAEKENDSASFMLFADDENRSPTSILATSTSTLQDQSYKNCKENASDEESLTVEAQTMSLKLFGKTVLVTESHRPSSSPTATRKLFSSESHQERSDTDEGKLMQTSPQNQMENEFSMGSNTSAWNPWPCGDPSMFYYMQVQKADPNPKGGASAVPMPWWQSQGSFPFPSHPSLNLNSEQVPSGSCPGEASEDREIQNKEESWTGSNTGSMSEVGMGDKNSDVVESRSQETSYDKKPRHRFVLRPSENSAFSLPRAKPSMKGFMPYKRCVAERDAQSCAVVGEEREGHRTRLCL